MTLACACIAPHGGEVIPQLVSKPMASRFAETTQGMNILASRITQSNPHTVVIATPHNLRLHRKITVVTAENSSGTLSGTNGRKVSVNTKCDVEFATRLSNEAGKRRLPVVGANYGTASGPPSNMPMDWGTLVPLWFIGKHGKFPRIVIVSPSREIPLVENVRFGKLLGELIRREKTKRFVFVASADQAHAHKKSGPYGFHSAASQYDSFVVNAVRSNNLRALLKLTSRLVDHAKPDSLWQMAILIGLLEIIPCNSEVVSYQVPTYYGMMCAKFDPV